MLLLLFFYSKDGSSLLFSSLKCSEVIFPQFFFFFALAGLLFDNHELLTPLFFPVSHTHTHKKALFSPVTINLFFFSSFH